MNLEVLSDPNCFRTLAQEWLNLLGNATTNHIFLTPQFQAAWWKHFATGELYIITLRSDRGELIGVAPFYRQDKTLHLLGSHEVSDYLDVIVHQDFVNDFLNALFNHFEENNLSEIHCISLPQSSQLLQLIKVESWRVEKTQQTVCPVISLPKTWDEYLTQIGKKQRHEIKRKWKNLEEQLHPTFSIITNEEEIDTHLNDFIRLHALSSTEKSAFWTPTQTEYFHELMTICAQQGWLKLFFLSVNDYRAATMLCFDYNNQFLLYNSGFDPQKFAGLSVGNVLTSYTIKHAIELCRSRYDFLRGDEEYKFRYGAVAEPIFDLTFTHSLA